MPPPPMSHADPACFKRHTDPSRCGGQRAQRAFASPRCLEGVRCLMDAVDGPGGCAGRISRVGCRQRSRGAPPGRGPCPASQHPQPLSCHLLAMPRALRPALPGAAAEACRLGTPPAGAPPPLSPLPPPRGVVARKGQTAGSWAGGLAPWVADPVPACVVCHVVSDLTNPIGCRATNPAAPQRACTAFAAWGRCSYGARPEASREAKGRLLWASSFLRRTDFGTVAPPYICFCTQHTHCNTALPLPSDPMHVHRTVPCPCSSVPRSIRSMQAAGATAPAHAWQENHRAVPACNAVTPRDFWPA